MYVCLYACIYIYCRIPYGYKLMYARHLHYMAALCTYIFVYYIFQYIRVHIYTCVYTYSCNVCYHTTDVYVTVILVIT